ncbi:hypothetical protein SAMN05443247_03123 [Bradyrhizobium erythrophlei]|nr:hypothetical protein SAMN05443247_03123 [Bradyrhizobium erythrophlei]
MPENFTQAQIDDLTTDAMSLVPPAKLPDFENDLKAKQNFPLNVQGRFLTGVIDAITAQEVEKYIDRPVQNNGNGPTRKPDKSNPWSAAGWNITAQGALAKRLGADKAASMASSAGCKLGDTKPNPHYS